MSHVNICHFVNKIRVNVWGAKCFSPFTSCFCKHKLYTKECIQAKGVRQVLSNFPPEIFFNLFSPKVETFPDLTSTVISTLVFVYRLEQWKVAFHFCLICIPFLMRLTPLTYAHWPLAFLLFLYLFPPQNQGFILRLTGLSAALILSSPLGEWSDTLRRENPTL